jgi:NAD(P)-dependent dehydrogenase (short-subunit alcohol dehydrogenase family)
MSISFNDRVVIVTGAGGGLGRAHALLFAKHGATLVINDVGPGGPAVVAEIEAAGGTAMASNASVTDFDAVQKMVADAMERYGRVDALINNAGILRDKTFAKMEMSDFRDVVDVHLMGAAYCSKAVWQIMRDQKYGRIVNTTSSTGLYGNFGQANYAAAKLGLVGLTNTLALEGERDNIRVNAFAPTAKTRMTEGVVPAPFLEAFEPDLTSPVVVYLASEDAPTKTICAAGAGTFERAYITLTAGVHLAGDACTPDGVAAAFAQIGDRTNESVPANGSAQGQNEMARRTAGAPAASR